MEKQVIPMQSLMQLLQVQLQEGGRANLTVTGYSMHPLLRNRRDSVVLVPPGKQKKGDIILYRRESGQFVLHRIIQQEQQHYICSGDNQVMREPVTREQILAVVDGFTRKGKSYSLDHPGYRVYTWMWVELFALRKYYLFIRRHLARFMKHFRRT
ncbi:MAG: S24/S26 family peptidase [Clostridia bacterium]|nr:S24/S26 family peptidase [Oscillospiraceae bacterium]MBO7162184.1 S24/S26 family peptidase [Clostridia bacterium]